MPSRIAATAADMPLFYQSFNSYAQAIAVKTAAHGLRVSLLPEIWDHGRITTRTIQVLPAPEDLPFPHVSQVFLIERHVSDLRGQPISAVAALGVASPAADQASPADLAGYVREQWSIESLHWSAAPCIKRTNPRSEPEMAPGSWLLSATSQSGHSEWPDAPTSPKPPDGPDAQWTAHSPSSDSHHDLGTAVREYFAADTCAA